MSYDVRLVDSDGQTVVVENHTEGGTYPVGGRTTAEMGVTVNYSKLYRLIGWEHSLRELDGKRATDVTQKLRDAVEKLGTQQHDDYWAPTPGNAGYALSVLLYWAEQHPDATFEVEA